LARGKYIVVGYYKLIAHFFIQWAYLMKSAAAEVKLEYYNILCIYFYKFSINRRYVLST